MLHHLEGNVGERNWPEVADVLAVFVFIKGHGFPESPVASDDTE